MEETRARAQQAGLSEKVHFISGVPAADVPPLLSALDVLCVPSLTTPKWREQFGRVIVEAMACGVPVIGSTSGEIPHVLGNAGLVVEEDNVQAWADALVRVMDNPSLLAEMRMAGIQHVATNYTNERLAAQIVEYYADLMKERSNA